MAMLFVSVAAAGLALVLFQPITKTRTQKLVVQGTSTSLLAVGLFGGLVLIMAP